MIPSPKPTLALLLALLAGLVCGPASASDLVLSRAVLEDTGGRLTIGEVVGLAFEPAGPTLAKGYSGSAFWVRLRVQAPPRGSEVVLRLRPSFLNEVRLYEAGEGVPAGWPTRVTGSRVPYEARDRDDAALSFVVDVRAAEATYYLRLKTDTVAELAVEALEPWEADRRGAQLDMLMVFFVTSLAYLLAWAVQSYLVDRQPVIGLFALHQAVYIASGLALAGYLARFAPAGHPELVDTLTAVLACAMNFTGLLFSRALFRPYDPPAVLMHGMTAGLAILPLQLIAIALGFTGEALAVNGALVMGLSWYFLAVAFAVRAEQVPSRRVLRLIFVAITGLATLSWAASLGWWTIASTPLTDSLAVVFNGLIAAGLLALLLNARLRQFRREAQQASQALALANKTLELERALKEEAEIRARTDYLTGLFNRRHFIELAERELTRSIRYGRPLALLMVDIDHFKQINDTLGHGAGDAVIQEVAHLMRAVVRAVDIVGRIGGEEFAAVLVEADAGEALQVSQRLCETVAGAAIRAPGGQPVQVTISLGYAERNDRAVDFDRLLQEADQALYKAKQAGRNRAVSAA